jgi:sialidase-1
MRDGDLVAIIGRYFRDDPNEGIINHANTGLVDMELFLARSGDDGRTWQPPQRIVPPVTGTGFEVAHPILELRDGRWLAPLATWHGWNSTPPYGDKAGVFVSTNQGRTWPTYLNVMDNSAEGIVYFEQGLAELADGRMLAVAWAFDGKKGTTRSIDWALSSGGAFAPPQRTSLVGETAKLVALPNGKALCVYRGTSPAGLCASLLDVQGDELDATEPVVLWKGERTQMIGAASAGEELANLKLGSPHMITLDHDRVLIVFWCCTECVFHIRWIRAKICDS